MTKKDNDRLEELYRTPAATLSEGDKVEMNALQEKKDLSEQIGSAIETFLKDSPLLKAQNPIEITAKKEEEKLQNPAYAMMKRLVGIRRNDKDMIKAADPIVVSANDDAGGYLVPAITEARILELAATYGQARAHMTVMPVGGGVTRIPKEGTLPTWTWGISENASITASKPTFGVHSLTPSKGGAIVVISNEMLRDANINVGAYVIKKIAQAKGTGEDSQFFAGTGSPFTGVFAVANTFGGEFNCTATNVVTFANMLSVVYGVDQALLVGAKWFMSRSVIAVVQGLVDEQSRPIFMPAANGQPATLLGYPVVVVENAPSSANVDNKPLLLLGNLENSIIGDVEGMNLTLLTEATIDATSLGQYDLSAIRVTASAAFTSGFTSAYSVLRCQNV